MTGRAAAFLDRDGTLIEDAHYLSDPRRVALLPGAAQAVRRLNEHDVPVVVVTNQSGIAQGLLTEDQYGATRARIDDLLREGGAHLLATYHCPHHPDMTGPCECRKPGTLLYRRAAAEHGLALAASFYVGDRWRDVAPGLELGGLVRLVPSGSTPPAELRRAKKHECVSPTLGEAVDWFLARR